MTRTAEATMGATRPLADRVADRARVSDTPGRTNARGRLRLALLGPALRLFFRPRLDGLEHLPDGPFLVVANHSGGGAAECACLAWLWHERFGNTRPVAGMATPFGFLIPGVASSLRDLGAIPSTYRHAEAAFAAGSSVLVFPGGDHEAFRPIWKANEVDFNGRKGFVRLAGKVGVPIVPLGIHGSHYTAPVLWRSRLLPWLLIGPRLCGVKRLPITLVGLAAGAAFAGVAWPVLGLPLALWLAGYVASVLTFTIPIIPWTIRARFGPPLPPEELFPGGDEEVMLARAGKRVEGEVQRLVLELARGGPP